MINPNEVTQYNAPREWQEEFLLFAVCVAGKSAAQQSVKLHNLLENLKAKYPYVTEPTPFLLVWNAARLGDLTSELERVRMGQYTRISKAFENIVASVDNISTVTVEDLEKIPGVGMKTARFFILHTRPGVRIAVLDTHILKHLRAHGFTAPKATPGSRKTYLALQEEFIKLADNSGLSVADYDLKVWKEKGIYA